MTRVRVRTKTPADFAGLTPAEYWSIVLDRMPHDNTDEHTCGIDCWVYFKKPGDAASASGHMMYGNDPCSAAGRYQWEQNQKIMTREQWDMTGQTQSRNCRVWDWVRALEIDLGLYPEASRAPIGSRRYLRATRERMAREDMYPENDEPQWLTEPDDLWGSPEGFNN